MTKFMIVLILISIITAIFSPIISKKLGLKDKNFWGVSYVRYDDNL